MYTNKHYIENKDIAQEYLNFINKHYGILNYELNLPKKYPCVVVEFCERNNKSCGELCFIEYVYFEDFEKYEN